MYIYNILYIIEHRDWPHNKRDLTQHFCEFVDSRNYKKTTLLRLSDILWSSATNEDVLTPQKLQILKRLPNVFMLNRVLSIETIQSKLAITNPHLIQQYIEQF